MNLTGKTVLIAGASTGIGRQVALQLAGRDTSLIVTARSADLLAELASAVTARGSRCLPLAGDATDEAGTAQLVGRAMAEAGPIDAALLNIGAGPAYNLDRATANEINECMRLNYDVTVNYLAPLIAAMRDRGGLIAHTNSLAGFLGIPMQGPYSAAKSAARLLIDTCRVELRDTDLRFLSIYPGFIATERTADDGVPAPFEISVERAAAQIIKAMESSRDDYAFPWQTAALTRALRLLPKPLAAKVMLSFVPDEY